jgi:L-asparaginase II
MFFEYSEIKNKAEVFMPVRLVEVYRGGIVESVHYGSIVAVDTDGHIICELGNPERLTYFRSAAKPLIAISSLEAGIAEEYGLDLKEIAIIASSHTGEKNHVEALTSIMEKTGILLGQFQCGVHPPLYHEAAVELYASGGVPTSLHCNCSGKHLGIMAAAKLKGMSVDDYHMRDHPIYNDVEAVLSDFCRLPKTSIIKHIDGCSIPVYGVPLKNMALAYANLADEGFMGGKYRKTQNLLMDAMKAHPEMVGGTDRVDTHVIRQFKDRLICKTGAEASHCVGLSGKGMGIALKIEDGSLRAVGPVILETLLQMKIISKEEIEELKEIWNPPILNHRKVKVGEIKAVFKLK